jgi:uncharacterized membrane protein
LAFDLSGILTVVVDSIIPFLELMAVSIILAGGFWAIATLVRAHNPMQARTEFSHSLLLGLDFTIGADMLKLAVAPNLSAVILAAGVTSIRIALTLTLLREQPREVQYQSKSTQVISK